MRVIQSYFFSLLLFSCISEAPVEFSSIKAESWKTYSNELVGYSLQYPEELEVDKSCKGKDALFRFDGYPIISINYVDSTEGAKRGLWIRHKSLGPTELSGKKGLKYTYIHYDAIFGMPVQSYVIPHKDRYLGLEFRKSGDLGPILEKIYNSFTLAEPVRNES